MNTRRASRQNGPNWRPSWAPENRVAQIAEDIVAHFEDRLEEMDGKAMIVCMSRRICVELYNELVRLRPDWYDQDDSKGQIKIVMTGSATDPPRLATAHQDQEPEGRPGKQVPEHRRPVPDCPSPRHVAHRLRCPQPTYHVPRQTHAGARPVPGYNEGEPGLQGQARRAGRRLPRPRQRPKKGGGDLHPERRPRPGHLQSSGRRGRDAREVRDLLRHAPRV